MDDGSVRWRTSDGSALESAETVGIPALEYCFGAFPAVASEREIFQFGTAGTDTAPGFEGQI